MSPAQRWIVVACAAATLVALCGTRLVAVSLDGPVSYVPVTIGALVTLVALGLTALFWSRPRER